MPLKENKIILFFKRNLILKVGLFNAFSVFFRLIFAYLTNKIIVLFLGPSGTALTEQTRNFVQAVQGVTTIGMNEGVIRYSAIYRDRNSRLVQFLSVTYGLILGVSVVLMIILLLFAKKINDFLFPGHDFTYLIYIIAFLLPVYAMQVILLAVLQGFQRYKKVTYIISLLHFSGMLLTLLLVYQMKMAGALMSVIFVPVTGFVLTLIIAKNDLRSLLVLPLGNGNIRKSYKHYFKRLIPFVWMAGMTAVIIPVTTILIRNLIISHFNESGIVQAGYWDAIRKISTFYFMFITPVFSMYYFPRISKNMENWKREMKDMLVKFYPFLVAGMIFIYFFRRYITLIVFSREYEPMNHFYSWQIAGDMIRIFSLLLAYGLWARVMVNAYLFAEISYWLLLYFLSAYLITNAGLNGVMQAYVISNLYYLILMLVYFKKDLFKKAAGVGEKA